MNKVCRGCSVVKVIFEFYKASAQPDGLDRLCKDCRKLASDKSKAKDPGRVKAVKKLWRQNNADKERAYGAAYREANKEKLANALKSWRERNTDKCRQHAYAWRKNNPEKYKEIIRLSLKKWRQKNPEAKRAEAAKRRALKRNSTGVFTKDDIARLNNLQRGKCAACKTTLTKYHVDHIIPLASGGINKPPNLQLLCPPCNLSKGARHTVDFMQTRGFLC